MSIFRYYGKVLRVAFTHSLDIAQGVIFAMLILVGLVAYLFPEVKVILDPTAWTAALTGWRVPAAILGTIMLIRLILAPYWIHQELHAQLGEKNRDEARLETRFGPDQPYNFYRAPYKRCRIGVYNHGPRVANNVKVWLRDTNPKPRCSHLIRADFPYRAARAGTDWNQQLHSIEIEDVHINPKEEELFDVAQTWTSSEGQLMVGGLDTKTKGDLYRWNIQPDEQWELTYEVTAANAAPVPFSLIVYVDGGNVMVRRKE